jgi:hypothetical protein
MPCLIFHLVLLWFFDSSYTGNPTSGGSEHMAYIVARCFGAATNLVICAFLFGEWNNVIWIASCRIWEVESFE